MQNIEELFKDLCKDLIFVFFRVYISSINTYTDRLGFRGIFFAGGPLSLTDLHSLSLRFTGGWGDKISRRRLRLNRAERTRLAGQEKKQQLSRIHFSPNEEQIAAHTPLGNSILWHLIAMARDTYFWKGEDLRSSKQVLLKSYEFILGQEASVKAVSQGCLCSHGWTSFWAKIKIFLYKPILINIFHFMVENFFVYDFFDFI